MSATANDMHNLAPASGRGETNKLRVSAHRKKQSRYVQVEEIMERLDAKNCDPFNIMADLAMSKIPCELCNGAKVVQWTRNLEYLGLNLRGLQEQIDSIEIFSGEDAVAAVQHIEHFLLRESTCMRCGGTGHGIAPLKVRGDMAKELANYLAPKQRHVEVEAGDKLTAIAQRIVDARQQAQIPGTVATAAGEIIEAEILDDEDDWLET